MRAPALLSSLLLAIGAPAAAADCPPLAGWDRVASDDALRWIVIGEMHGSNEVPALFADIVCLTAEKRPVVVALEQPAHDQPAIDAFMASDGGAEARRAFLRASIWNAPIKDGRSSEAQLRLFETLRQMRAEGRIAAVIAFVPTLTGPYNPAAYEKTLAEELQRAARPGAVVVALTGNVHAMRTVVRMPTPYTAMAGHLPADATATFDTVGEGGTIWACINGECRSHPVGVAWGRTRGVVMGSDPAEPYSGTIYLGTATSASAPARPE